MTDITDDRAERAGHTARKPEPGTTGAEPAGGPGAGPRGEGEPLDPRRWFALAIVLTAGFMDLLDVTIVNIAIPAIQTELGASHAAIQWIAAAYTLSFAVVLITGGRLGDIFGRRRLFVIGMSGFTLASLLCGVATGPAMLVGARAFQGVMAAIMVPQILAIVHVTFPPSERGKVFGMYGGIAGLAAISGPILGGLIVEWDLFGWGWRPIFLVNIPVGVIGVLATLRYVRESRSPHPLRLDLIGMGLITAGLLLLVFPLVQGRELGWPWWVFALMGSSVPVLGAFVAYERVKTRRDGSPLTELRLFRSRSYSAGLTVLLVFNSCMAVFFFTWTLFLQLGLGWSALKAGLTGVPFSLGVSIAAGLSIQVLVPRIGRGVVSLGSVVLATGMLAYAWTIGTQGAGISPWHMTVPLTVAGLGMGLMLPPLADMVMTGVGEKDAGSASGVVNAVNQLGNAFGVALIGVVFFAMLGGQAAAGAGEEVPRLRRDLVAAGLPAEAADPIVAGFRECVRERASEEDPSVVPAPCREDGLAGVPQPARDRVAALLRDAGAEAGGEGFSRSFRRTLYGVAGGMAVCFALVFLLPRRVTPRPEGTAAH